MPSPIVGLEPGFVALARGWKWGRRHEATCSSFRVVGFYAQPFVSPASRLLPMGMNYSESAGAALARIYIYIEGRDSHAAV